MDTKQEFIRLMNTQTEMALASCTDGWPNVRIVNFYFDEETKLILFSSFKDNEKVKEFEANNKVAFTTIPQYNVEHIKAKGTIQKSLRSLSDVAQYFINKIPSYQEMIAQAGDDLVLFEISFNSASVTLDFENIEMYNLTK